MDQYVIVPKKSNGESLYKYEILIYVCIRRYMNKDNMEAFPSIDTICKDSGCSKVTVLKTIKAIVSKGYMQIKKLVKGQKYIFNNEKSFEPFSYEFLDNKSLSKSEKLQILCTQQHMYKDNGVGKVSYSDRQLAELTGLDRRIISRNNQSLIRKSYMTQVTLKTRDSEDKTLCKETIYHLNEIGQAIVFALQNHEERIQSNEDKIKQLEEKYTKDVKILCRKIESLEKQLYGESPNKYAFE